MLRTKLLAAAALAATLVSAGTAHATLSAAGSVGGAPTGATLDNLDVVTGGVSATGIGISFVTDAALVTGALNNFYAPPFLSGGNGAGFGNANGVDTTQYITTGSTGAFATAKVTLTLPATETYFGLLWGSVDAYNTLTFLDASNNVVGVLTGTDVLGGANGDQGVNGTLYVNINSSVGFTSVVATSSQYAFEFDNVAFNPTNISVPEPVSLALLGSGLLGLGLARRRRG